ncbi:NADPH:adrenodoxin oxidoreductase, mitochondrial [Toxocara canis]|uniref:NADPH:adrenodoxin oxidoreductase, mitochondrial n=1 Tax=Toxocara canis TaxID=6265 RepID=A0A0B2VU85_TOXCA|nr:NADPH:adrenodoxin oxidoreductase, mitochondrial [Toxocara canis]
MKGLPISTCRFLATLARAPRIAVVGSGPGGLYVCDGVLRRLPKCEVDVVECNVVPYGLIRYGVAPDHPEVKNCINKFDRMFTANAHRLSLFCNVCVGRDITFDELCADYDAVVLAYGARRQRRLAVPGVSSKNVFSGGDFVSWYNAHPGAEQPKLDCENAVVVGVGNVALDCCRILLSAGGERLAQSDMPSQILDHLARSKVNTVTIVGRRGPLDVVVGVGNVALDCCRILLSAGGERLAQSDMPSQILDHLARSKVNTVTIVGRRGPLDASFLFYHPFLVSFTIKELREQVTLPGCSFTMQLSDADLKAINESLASLPRPRKRLTELMMKNWNRDEPRSRRHCELLFRRSPVEILADDDGWVSGVRMRNSQTETLEDLRCGLLIYSLGFENVVLDGVPQDENGRIKMRDSVRVHTAGETLVYASGWCAHTPRGVIANTQVDSANVAKALCSDIGLRGVKPHIESSVAERLKLKGVQYTTWQQWKAIDEREKQLGHHKIAGMVVQENSIADDNWRS